MHVVSIKVVVALHEVVLWSLLLVELVLILTLHLLVVSAVISIKVLSLVSVVECVHLVASPVRIAWVVSATTASSSTSATRVLETTRNLHASSGLRFFELSVAMGEVAFVAHLAVAVVLKVTALCSLVFGHVDLLLCVTEVSSVWVHLSVPVALALHFAIHLAKIVHGLIRHLVLCLVVLRLCFFRMVILLGFLVVHMLSLGL